MLHTLHVRHTLLRDNIQKSRTLVGYWDTDDGNVHRKVTLTKVTGQEPGNTKYKNSSDQSNSSVINWIM